jgi:hypothetical protein
VRFPSASSSQSLNLAILFVIVLKEFTTQIPVAAIATNQAVISVIGHHKKATAVDKPTTAIVVIHNAPASFGFWSMNV